MTRTGKFITAEELESLKTQMATSGMWLSGGQPMGDPAHEVHKLTQKYGLEGHAVDPANGEFVSP